VLTGLVESYAPGRSVCDPRRMKVRQWPVGVAPGAAGAEKGLGAETFPVSVEEEYVLLEA
jgi:3-phenylpropionate/trans-cinnamate dioxygenase ferredoxin subunit